MEKRGYGGANFPTSNDLQICFGALYHEMVQTSSELKGSDDVQSLTTGLLCRNKARYMATLVACGCAGAVLKEVTRASGQEPYAQKCQKRK